MKMIKKEIIGLIKSEIEWCKNNPQTMPDEFVYGFIKGLKQAITLIKSIPKQESK